MRRSLRNLIALNIDRARSWGIDPVMVAVPPRVYRWLSRELVELGPKEFQPDEPPCMFLLHDGVAITSNRSVPDVSEVPMRIRLLAMPKEVPTHVDLAEPESPSRSAAD